jgi:hypothetical protein
VKSINQLGKEWFAVIVQADEHSQAGEVMTQHSFVGILWEFPQLGNEGVGSTSRRLNHFCSGRISNRYTLERLKQHKGFLRKGVKGVRVGQD